MQRMNSRRDSGGPRNFGIAWLLLCLAFCAHVADEALTGRPAPGFYSSPLLFAASIYLLLRLRTTRQSRGEAVGS